MARDTKSGKMKGGVSAQALTSTVYHSLVLFTIHAYQINQSQLEV